LRWSECTNKHLKLQQNANTVVMHIRSRTMLTVYHTYSSNVEEKKAIAFKTLRAVTCWANRCLHGCLRGWEARATEESSRKRISRRIMLRWKHMVLARALSSWNDHVKDSLHKERVLERTTLRMRIAGMYKARASWLTWYEVCALSKSNAFKVYKIVIRWEKIKYVKTFGAWEEQGKAQRKLRFAATKAVKHWTNNSLSLAWVRWWGETRRSRVVKKVAQRMRSTGMYKAWNSWRGNCDALCRMNALHMRSVKSMHKRISAVSLCIWLQNSKEQIRMETECTKIKMRTANRGIALMFLTWYAHSTEKARLKKMCRKLAVRMQSHMICLVKSLNRWGATMVELRRQRRVLSTVAARMRYACVYAALASWVDINKGRRRRWDVLRKILNRMISEMFLTWCVA
jgi:hypothetical protein